MNNESCPAQWRDLACELEILNNGYGILDIKYIIHNT